MNTLSLSCIVIEDENEIRKWLIEHLRTFEELDIIGEAAHIDQAYTLLAKELPDLVFMDIKLVGGDAFTLLERLKKNDVPIPYIVMVTGFPDYAMKSINEYQKYVLQYIAKPYVDDWKNLFRDAIDKVIAKKLEDERNGQNPSFDHIFLMVKGEYTRFNFKEIAYIEAAGGYAEIHAEQHKTHKYLISESLTNLMKLLPNNFLHLSRFHIINLDKIHSIHRGERTVRINFNDDIANLRISDNAYKKLIDSLPIAQRLLLEKE